MQNAIREDFDKKMSKWIKFSLKKDFREKWQEKFKIEVKKFLIENNIRKKIEFDDVYDENKVFLDALLLFNNEDEKKSKDEDIVIIYELLFFKLFKENHILDYEKNSVGNSIRLRGEIKKAFIKKYKSIAIKNHYERIYVPMILDGQTTSKTAKLFMEVIKSEPIMQKIISNMLR